MSELVDRIIQILAERSYSADLDSVLTNVADLFEKARGMQPSGWTDEVLAAEVTTRDATKLRNALLSFVERTGYGNWELSKCGDQTGLKTVYIRSMRRHLDGDSGELYQAMIALDNLGERLFPTGSASIDDPENRYLAAKFLEDQ